MLVAYCQLYFTVYWLLLDSVNIVYNIIIERWEMKGWYKGCWVVARRGGVKHKGEGGGREESGT